MKLKRPENVQSLSTSQRLHRMRLRSGIYVKKEKLAHRPGRKEMKKPPSFFRSIDRDEMRICRFLYHIGEVA